MNGYEKAKLEVLSSKENCIEFIEKLKNDIFDLESTIAHSYSAEEVTNMIDNVVEQAEIKLNEAIKEISGFTDISAGRKTIVNVWKQKMRGNWKYTNV